jgi:hypothetical protein
LYFLFFAILMIMVEFQFSLIIDVKIHLMLPGMPKSPNLGHLDLLCWLKIYMETRRWDEICVYSIKSWCITNFVFAFLNFTKPQPELKLIKKVQFVPANPNSYKPYTIEFFVFKYKKFVLFWRTQTTRMRVEYIVKSNSPCRSMLKLSMFSIYILSKKYNTKFINPFASNSCMSSKTKINFTSGFSWF